VGLFTIEIVKKFEFQKSKMATDRPIITKGGMMIKMALLTILTVKKLILKIQGGGWPLFWKPLDHHISAAV